MGIGFTFGLTCIGIVREILGAGQLFGFQILSLKWYTPINIFIMAPGAFLVLAFLVALMSIVRQKMEAKGKPLAEPAGCQWRLCRMQHVCNLQRKEKKAADAEEKVNRRNMTDADIIINCSWFSICK